MKKIAVFSMVLLLMGFVAIANAATFTGTTYDSFGDFLNDCPGVVVENFNDDKLNVTGLSIDEVGGAGTFNFGYYENIVDKDVNLPAGRFQVIKFDAMGAFGGWFDLANPGGPGSSIDVYIADTNTFVANIPNSQAGQFFGFSNPTPFTMVRLEEGPGAGMETYQIVDLAICPVPVPSSLLLLGTGFLGLLSIGIRRKSA